MLFGIALVVIGLSTLVDGTLQTAGWALICAGVLVLYLSMKIESLKGELNTERQKQKIKSKRNSKIPKKNSRDQPTVQEKVAAVSQEIKSPAVFDPESIVPRSLLNTMAGENDSEGSATEGVDSPQESIIKTEIITRTSKSASGRTKDFWESERSWTSRETDELIGLYRRGKAVGEIAVSMSMDSKDIAYKLTRLAFRDSTALEGVESAERDGKRWSAEDHQRLIEMNEAGIRLAGMAKVLGRTKLAIGWRLAENQALKKLN